MQTRKSSPLPNPNDTINKYKINYHIHYQNFHNYLQQRIKKEKHTTNLLKKEFSRLEKKLKKQQQTVDKSKEISNESDGTIMDQMKKIYEQICKGQMEIYNLYQEDEAVILQLCQLLDVRKREIQIYRQSDQVGLKSGQLTFLHYQRLSYSQNQQNDLTKTLSFSQEDISNSLENTQNSSKDLCLNGTQINPQIQADNQQQKMNKNQTQENFKQIKQFQQFIQPQKSIVAKESQQQGNSQLCQISPLTKDESNEFQTKVQQNQESTESQNIDSVINQYTKNQQKNLPDIVDKKCIEISSSFEDKTGKKEENLKKQQAPESKFQEIYKSCKQKTKKKLKSCITILD